MRQFAYRPRPAPMLLGGAFFGACAAFYVHLATTNRAGLVINHVISLEAAQARTFFGALAAASLGFVVLAVVVLVDRLFGTTRHLVLDDDALVVPFRWSRGEHRIPYDAVTTLVRHNVHGQRFLEIQTAAAKVTINGIMLGSADELTEVETELTARIAASRRHHSHRATGGGS